MKKLVGQLLSGSLSEGFVMRLSQPQKLEEIKTGKFVCIKGTEHTFFSLITDLSLAVSNQDILLFPPTANESLLTAIIAKKDIYATARIKAILMLTKDRHVMPVKTIPPHFSPIYEASPDDVAAIFGDENDTSQPYFNIGSPLDMDTPVCINLEKLTERSNGIFGKTGTGKTFLTRLVLAGLMKHQKAVNLIFDMHSEYGFQARKEGSNYFVKGLKTLFGSQVALFSLDPTSSRRRGALPDVELTISLNQIAVDDIVSLQDELNLHPTAVEAAHLIATIYQQEWLSTLYTNGNRLKEFAQEIGAHTESVAALYRKIRRVGNFPFVQKASHSTNGGLDELIDYLSKGISVIIEFGNQTSTLCYLLIANMISRRIHTEWIRKTELFLASQKKEDEPQKLMITIEEAHKFLNPYAARQTIFGTIAREMRKYYVSLLVVDQRPSGIDQEVLSQIGTKIIAQLNDEKDISAVLTGTAHAQELKTVLATLDSKKQALILGHAVTMPVVVQTREYDENFYQAMSPEHYHTNITELINELY